MPTPASMAAQQSSGSLSLQSMWIRRPYSVHVCMTDTSVLSGTSVEQYTLSLGMAGPIHAALWDNMIQGRSLFPGDAFFHSMTGALRIALHDELLPVVGLTAVSLHDSSFQVLVTLPNGYLRVLDVLREQTLGDVAGNIQAMATGSLAISQQLNPVAFTTSTSNGGGGC
jgi:hypothetical protein